MGVSQDGDGSGIGVDCSVGTIVWVRRRNGSWWPGRILGPEELSVSHLMSPRSGTPVKLLGREDASVDWYNLEKSKRVKAFRCGEFDACIEKAEASLGVPIKKREKYARREDAILHALELERKQHEMRQQKQAIVSNGITGNSIVALKREFKNISSLDAVTRNDDSSTHSKYSIHNSPTLTKKADLLDDEENMNNSRSINEEKSNKQLRWEEGISGAIHRVRGLRDFGLRVAPKKKPPPSVAWSDTKEPVENNVDSIPCAGHTVRTSGHISSCNDTFSIHRKRPLDGPPIEESLVKKRDRRRPLVQVLQSSAKSQAFGSHLDHCADLAPVQGEKHHVGGIQRAKQRMCVYLPPDSFDSRDNQGYSSDDMRPATQFVLDNSLDPSSSLVEDFTSGMIQMDESDSSPRDYLESDMEEGDILEDTGQLLASGPKENDSSASHVSEESEDMDNDDIPCSGPSGYISHLHPYEQTAVAPAQVGVSKWHMKGKRNNRNLVRRPRRPVELRNDKICTTGFETYDVSVRETIYGAKCGTLKIGTEPANHRNAEQAFYHINEDDYALEDDLIGEDILQEQMNVYQNQKHSLVSKATMDLGRSRIGFNNLESDSRLVSTLDWEADGLSHGARRKFWQEFDEFYDPVYDSYISIEMDSNLFNVDLKVKASYQGEHVPLVSLMSRLNGKAIIGHPIQIEILEDGFTSQYFPSNCPDGSSTRQPVWRTGRRTAMQRVPRSNPVTSSWENDEAGGSHYPERGSHYSEREDKPSLYMYFSHSKNLSRSTKKRVFSAHRPPLGNSQKSQKRVSSSSQKTRTLSSFASERRLGRGNGETRFTRSNDLLGGLMKPVGQVPLITCIPVKVAFSRILEAIGRSSTTTSHHVRMANLAVRDQS